MKPLARRAVASLACAALIMAQWPASALAAAPEPDPAAAMKLFKELGIYKDDADPVKTYFGDGKTLTPIGKTLFLSLQHRYNKAEEVESMKPILERLRGLGPYSQARQDGAARAMKIFQDKFGSLADAPSGSVEEAFRTGAMREALMTGASIADPPKGAQFAQVETAAGFEFWDKDGLAFRMTKNKVTTYNRELQKTQRAMNQNRPPQVEMIPETGRYSYQMLQYSYWRLRNQEVAYADAARTDRMIAIAELLGLQFPNDMWFNEKGLEEDLIRRAKAKTYNHHGTVYSVFDIVDAKFTQRQEYLKGRAPRCSASRRT
ncbi:MAG: hypothetical protein M0D55_14040 [Elusimicrobiota bacterium]|nr:MAG: hypothetical protein M0D55_14040 [Elusimicrobiota bacterium]